MHLVLFFSSNKFFRDKVSDIFELLFQMNLWLEQIPNDNLYIDGICQLLQVR